MLSKHLKDLMTLRGITKEELAEQCGLPLETVRNLYYEKTKDPRISNIIKIAEALNVSIDCLVGNSGHDSDEDELLQDFRACGRHGKSMIRLTAKYEALASADERKKAKYKVPCFVPHKLDNDGFTYDKCDRIEVYTSNSDAYMGIQMINNDYVPYYCKGDIVLVSRRFPESNEYGVFYQDGTCYIKQFIEENEQYVLKTRNSHDDIILKRMDEIENMGTCCGVIRE